MMVYLAADLPLREVAWDDAAPAFHTTPLVADEARQVRGQFSKPHLIYAGAHEGCACGFQLGEYPLDDAEPEEAKKGRESLHAFAEYLRAEMFRVGSIEVFACWDGEQEAAIEHRRTLTPDAIDSDDFFFLQKERSTIEPDWLAG